MGTAQPVASGGIGRRGLLAPRVLIMDRHLKLSTVLYCGLAISSVGTGGLGGQIVALQQNVREGAMFENPN